MDEQLRFVTRTRLAPRRNRAAIRQRALHLAQLPSDPRGGRLYSAAVLPLGTLHGGYVQGRGTPLPQLQGVDRHVPQDWQKHIIPFAL